jgi:hypothetical protein
MKENQDAAGTRPGVEAGPVVKPMDFAEFVGGMEGGAVNRRASRELEKLVEAVRTLRKSGRLIVELKIEPATPKDASQVFVTPTKIETKLPRPAADPSIYFTTPSNTLSRENPRQLRFRTDGFENESE